MTSGAVTLGDIAGRITLLEIACAKCERRGWLCVAKLTAQHGPGMGLPELRGIVAGDCPHVGAVAIHDLCGVYYPQLERADAMGSP